MCWDTPETEKHLFPISRDLTNLLPLMTQALERFGVYVNKLAMMTMHRFVHTCKVYLLQATWELDSSVVHYQSMRANLFFRSQRLTSL